MNEASQKEWGIWVLALSVVIAQALSLTVIGPWVAREQNSFVGNFAFVVIRLALVMGFAVLATGLLRFEQFRVLKWVGFLEAVNHVLLKGIWIVIQSEGSVGAWEAEELAGLALNLVAGYMLFVPLMFLLGLAGWAVGRWGLGRGGIR